MSGDERLLQLLPAAFRRADVESGQPLRALLAILEDELDALRRETETLHDSWFVETCEEWLVPYVGELVGTQGLRSVGATGFSLRGFVANAVARRRRKGTAAATEQLARDVTGYPARAQEMYAVTATTIADDHLRGQDQVTAVTPAPPRHPFHRMATLGTVDLRDVEALAELDGPFDAHVRTADLRGARDGRANANLVNLAVHLFRVGSRPLGWVDARAVLGQAGLFRVDPAGIERPLYTRTVPESDIAALTGPTHVPRPLGRLALDAAVRAGATLPVRVRTTDGSTSNELAVEACDLTGVAPSHRPDPGTASIDPVLGLVAVHGDDLPGDTRLQVSSAYGFPGGVGAGPHDRSTRVAEQLRTGAGGTDESVSPTWTRWVAAEPTTPSHPEQVGTLAGAVEQWNALVGGLSPNERAETVGLVVLADDGSYNAPVTIELLDGARLHIVAARRAVDAELGAGPLSGAVAAAVRPHVMGDVVVRGTSAAAVARTGGLACSGLLLEGSVQVADGDLEVIDLADCTVVPSTDGGPAVEVVAGNAQLAVRVGHCVLAGPVTCGATIASLEARDSLVMASRDGADTVTPDAITVPGASVTLEGASVVGRVEARTLHASDCILDPGATDPLDQLEVEITQQGCLRYSWVPDVAASPRRHRCEPDRSLAALARDPSLTADPLALARARNRVRARVQPRYAGTTIGDPALHVLTPDTARSLRTAASDGGEPGVWHHLEHATRLSNLDAALATDLRFGLDAAIVEHA